MKSYKHRVWDLIEDFQAFNLLSISRNLNKHADKLVAIGDQYDIPSNISNTKEQQYVKVIVRSSISNNIDHWQCFDSDHQIINFLRE